jgi:hypothetical protein
MTDVDQGWHDLLKRLPTLNRAHMRQKRIRLLTIITLIVALVTGGVAGLRYCWRLSMFIPMSQAAIGSSPPGNMTQSAVRGAENTTDAPTGVESRAAAR